MVIDVRHPSTCSTILGAVWVSEAYNELYHVEARLWIGTTTSSVVEYVTSSRGLKESASRSIFRHYSVCHNFPPRVSLKYEFCYYFRMKATRLRRKHSVRQCPTRLLVVVLYFLFGLSASAARPPPPTQPLHRIKQQLSWLSRSHSQHPLTNNRGTASVQRQFSIAIASPRRISALVWLLFSCDYPVDSATRSTKALCDDSAG